MSFSLLFLLFWKICKSQKDRTFYFSGPEPESELLDCVLAPACLRVVTVSVLGFCSWTCVVAVTTVQPELSRKGKCIKKIAVRCRRGSRWMHRLLCYDCNWECLVTHTHTHTRTYIHTHTHTHAHTYTHTHTHTQMQNHLKEESLVLLTFSSKYLALNHSVYTTVNKNIAYLHCQV